MNSVNPEQLANASMPIVVRLAGKVRVPNPTQRLNVLSQIFKTPGGIV